jgi:hypothetical protein
MLLVGHSHEYRQSNSGNGLIELIVGNGGAETSGPPGYVICSQLTGGNISCQPYSSGTSPSDNGPRSGGERRRRCAVSAFTRPPLGGATRLRSECEAVAVERSDWGARQFTLSFTLSVCSPTFVVEFVARLLVAVLALSGPALGLAAGASCLVDAVAGLLCCAVHVVPVAADVVFDLVGSRQRGTAAQEDHCGEPHRQFAERHGVPPIQCATIRRPPKNVITAMTRKMKKRILAMLAAPAAMPKKPNTPATSAMMKKTAAQ